MAVINALDGNEPSSLHGFSASIDTTVIHKDKPCRPQSHRSRKMNTHQQRKEAAAAKAVDASDLPTDVSVTPLSSVEQSLSPSPPIRTVNKDRFERRLVERKDSSVRSALTELEQLRASFSNHRFLHIPPPLTAATPVGKENLTDRPSKSAGRRFGSLLDSLRRMNPELGAGRGRSILPSVSSMPFRILRLPSPHEQDSAVKLPRVIQSARPAWESVNDRPSLDQHLPMPSAPQGNELRQMPAFEDNFPLLHITKDHFSTHDSNTELPDNLPFSMLQMMDPYRRQVPFFVPPENIVSCNNNNRETSTARSGMPSARSDPHTGRPDFLGSSQRSVELLRLMPSVSEVNDTSKSDSRQVMERRYLISSFLFLYINLVIVMLK